MAFKNIKEEDVEGLGVYGLPDTPELDVTEMQTKFDEYSWFLKNFINSHIAEIEAKSASWSLGANIPNELEDIVPEGTTEEERKAYENVQTILNALAVNRNAANRIINMLSSIEAIATNMDVSSNSLIPTTKAIADWVEAIGGGDMTKATYDHNQNGIVDDSEKLGGYLPFFYAKQSQVTAHEESINILNINFLAVLSYLELSLSASIEGMTDNYVIYEFDSNTTIIDGELDDSDAPYFVWA